MDVNGAAGSCTTVQLYPKSSLYTSSIRIELGLGSFVGALNFVEIKEIVLNHFFIANNSSVEV